MRHAPQVFLKSKPGIDPAIIDRVESAIVQGSCRLVRDLNEADVLVVAGGDGTMLWGVHDLLEQDREIPILGVMEGSLGFLTGTETADLTRRLLQWQEGLLIEDRRRLLQMQQGGRSFFALNEVVISQQGAARVVDVEARIHDRLLTHYRGDGVIVATPTGSTAYSLSVGGPLTHPQLCGYIVSPISPHSLSQKPLVLHDSDHLTLMSSQENPSPLMITLDGRECGALEPGVRLSFCLSDRSVCLLRSPDEDFYATLKHKLQWG